MPRAILELSKRLAQQQGKTAAESAYTRRLGAVPQLPLEHRRLAYIQRYHVDETLKNWFRDMVACE